MGEAADEGGGEAPGRANPPPPPKLPLPSPSPGLFVWEKKKKKKRPPPPSSPLPGRGFQLHLTPNFAFFHLFFYYYYYFIFTTPTPPPLRRGGRRRKRGGEGGKRRGTSRKIPVLLDFVFFSPSGWSNGKVNCSRTYLFLWMLHVGGVGICFIYSWLFS